MSFTFDEFFPFDPGHGASANAARWRKMAQLWAPDGVLNNYLNELNAVPAFPQVTVQTGAVFIHGYYAELATQQTFTVGTNGTIVAQVNMAINSEVINLVYRDSVTDYGSNPANSYEQDANIWEIPVWGVSGGNTLLDLRTRINPATGLRWWAQSATTQPIATSTTLQSSFVTARIPYKASGFLHGTLMLQFTDLSQAQSAICQLTYQWGVAGEQQTSPTATPSISGGGPANQSIWMPVSLTGVVPVTQGKKTAGWRVTAGTGPGIQVASMTLSLWTGGVPAAA